MDSIQLVLALIVVLIVGCILARLYVVYNDKIKFYTTGFDSGFRLGEINALWKTAKRCHLDEPMVLYSSITALNKCIALILSEVRRDGGKEPNELVAKLYKFRTKVALKTDEKRNIESTKYLDVGQRLRMIFPGKGIFFSRIINNGRELTVSLPRQDVRGGLKAVRILPLNEWLGKEISVYLWRKGDACYVFDTIVEDVGNFQGEQCLFLKQSNTLERAQKRQSIRCACQINAQMYIIKSSVVDYKVRDYNPGLKCILEDISEDGAMIRIGGMGKIGSQIKLQFQLNSVFIMMFGIIRAVEYNEQMKQSRLHFECTHIEPDMKNAVLSYVYNIVPESEKEAAEAISASEQDQLSEEEDHGEMP